MKKPRQKIGSKSVKNAKIATSTAREKQLALSRAALQMVIATVGSQSELGAQLGVTQAAVSKWLQRGWVSPERAREMESLTGVSRAMLVDPRIANALLPVEMEAA